MRPSQHALQVETVGQIADQLDESVLITRRVGGPALDGREQWACVAVRPVDRLRPQAFNPDAWRLRHEPPPVRRGQVAACEVGVDVGGDAGRDRGRVAGPRPVHVRRRGDERLMLLAQLGGQSRNLVGSPAKLAGEASVGDERADTTDEKKG